MLLGFTRGMKAGDTPRLRSGQEGVTVIIGVPVGFTRGMKAVDIPRLPSGKEGLTAIIGVPLGFTRGKKAVDTPRLRLGQEGLAARGECGKGYSDVGKEGRNGDTVSRTLTRQYRMYLYLSNDKLRAVD